MTGRDTLVRILDRARWAPSGDNTQPWRFEIPAHDRILVIGSDTRDWCLYDLDGRASYMAHGAVLETLRIAASVEGLASDWCIVREQEGGHVVYEVRLSPADSLGSDPLSPFIESRTVQRRSLSVAPLGHVARAALAASVGPEFNVEFFEEWRARLHIAKLLWVSADIRLRCPEAYPVHRDIIEWGVRFSEDRIPEAAIGVDPVTASLMKWAMKSWGRVDALNRFCFGTIPPRLMLDFLPGVACGAHALVVARTRPSALLDFVKSGVAMQRLWLTAEMFGLRLQPEMTPLIFSWYSCAGRKLSADERLNQKASILEQRMRMLFGGRLNSAVFLCRLGFGHAATSRSLRLPVTELVKQ